MEHKPKLSLIDPKFLIDLAFVLEMGDEKYGPGDWMKESKAINASHAKVIDAIHRHLAAYENGQDMDIESGQHHLAHVVARVMILMWYIRNGMGIDDRPFKLVEDDIPF